MGIDSIWGLRWCHEAILAWHMRLEIPCLSGQYLAMAQIRHGDEQKPLKQANKGNTLRNYACEFCTYLSIVVVSDLVIAAVCQEQASLHMTWHCTAWSCVVLYGSHVFVFGL